MDTDPTSPFLIRPGPGIDDAVPPPERIGKYLVLGEIGAGGMGRIYKAHNPDLAGLVAIKVPNPSIVARLGTEELRREAMLLHAASDPHISRVLDAGVFDGPRGPTPFIVTEFLEGAHHLNSTAVTSLPLREVVRIFTGAVSGVATLHSAEIIHADLKPSNILVVQRNGRWSARVIDFGLAARLHGRGAHVHGGTAPYMAPELLDPAGSRCTKASDIYALGATLYELLCTVTPPRPGEQPAMRPPAELNPFIDRRLERIILRCLERQPDRRYPDAGALRTELDSWRRSPAVRLGNAVGRTLAFRPLVAMLLILLGVFALSATVVDALTAQSARVQAMCEPLFALWPAPPCAPASVCIIGLTDNDKLRQAGVKLGDENIDPAKPVTLRPLHAALARKLAGAGPAVVAWDIFFTSQSEFDPTLRKELEALVDAGTPVVLGVRNWALNERGEPPLCPELLNSPKLRWGPATMDMGMEGSRLAPLAVASGVSPPTASIALQTVAAARVGGMIPSLSFETDRAVRVTYRQKDRPDSRASRWSDREDRLNVTQIAPHAATNASGIDPTARVAELAVPFAGREDWASRTFDLADVLAMSPEELQAFRRRIILVGDLRPNVDIITYPPERKTSGVIFQAQTIEQINQESLRLLPNLFGQIAIILGAALLGMLIATLTQTLGPQEDPAATRPGGTNMTRLSLLVLAPLLAGTLSLAACLLAFRLTPWQVMPPVPALTAVLAALCAGWAHIRRSRYANLGNLPA